MANLANDKVAGYLTIKGEEERRKERRAGEQENMRGEKMKKHEKASKAAGSNLPQTCK